MSPLGAYSVHMSSFSRIIVKLLKPLTEKGDCNIKHAIVMQNAPWALGPLKLDTWTLVKMSVYSTNLIKSFK